jgi:tetratricopeptide (TPR) repeat protein
MTAKFFLLLFIISGISFAQVDAGNKFMLAQSYIQAGQFEKAKPVLEELYRGDPGNYEYFQVLNDVYTQMKDYDASIVLIEDRINISNPDINLYGMLGTTYYLKADENKAFKTWDFALEKFPQNEAGYRVIANYAIERRAFEKAIQYLKKGQDISSNPIYFAFDLANLYSITMQYKEATEEYCMILARNNEQFDLIENKILSYISKPGALKTSIPVVEKYSNGGGINFKFLLARLYVQNKLYDKAYGLYIDIDELQKAQGAQLLHFAQFLFGDKIFKTASEVYEKIINNFPGSPLVSIAKLGYAKTLEALMEEKNTARISSWKPFYKIGIETSPDVEKIILAYLEIIRIYPNTETANEALLRIGEFKLKQNEVTEAEKYFQNLIDYSPLSQYAADAYINLAKVSVFKGNLNGAVSNYLKIIANSSISIEKKNFTLYRLARVYFYKGEFEKTKEYLNEILDNLGNNSANDALSLSLLLNTSINDSSNLVIFAQAELFAEQGSFEEAAKNYKIVAEEPQKFMLENLADLRVAEMDLAENNIDSASSRFRKIADDVNNNIFADKALYLLGKILQYDLENKTKAVETYENLLAKFPNSLYLEEARAEIIKLRDKTVDSVE